MWFDSLTPYHFDFVAQKNINVGNEICTYYGDNYWPQKIKRDGKK